MLRHGRRKSKIRRYEGSFLRSENIETILREICIGERKTKAKVNERHIPSIRISNRTFRTDYNFNLFGRKCTKKKKERKKTEAKYF